MKTIKLTLVATAVAGLLLTAGAQPGPDQGNADTNNLAAPDSGGAPPMPADAGGPPSDANGQAPMPPDANGQPQVPEDANGQAPMPADAGADANAQPAQDNSDAQAQPAGERSVVQPLTITPTQSHHNNAPADESNFEVPAVTGNNPDAIMLNFNNAPLEQVLSYLSDAAGFIIVLQTHVNGSVSIISKHPVTRQQAVDLLNAELNKNGYAAVQNDRMLTIMSAGDAITADIPVKMGNDPDTIPKNAEIVTQIIPIRFVEARQLVSDLTSFVSPHATVVANEAGNAIVITDTQDNIRHLVEIIKAIDSSAEAETEIKVFQLKYASPLDVANELGTVFPSGGSSSGGSQAPIRFGGGPFGGGGGFARFFGGGGGGGGGGAGAGGSSSESDRIKKETQVTAVADARTSSVIVTAPKDMMDEIAEMMTQLDVPSDRDQNVYTFQLKNADAQAVASELQTMFQSGNSSRGGSSSTTTTGDPLATRAQNNASTTGSSSSSTGFGGSSIGGGGGGRGGSQF